MNQLNKKLLLTGCVAVAILAGCDGSDDDNPSPTSPPSATAPIADTEKSVPGVIDYISNMIANFSENSDPVDVNSITLAVDDTAEPTGLK